MGTKTGSLEFRETVFKKYLLMLFPLSLDQYEQISESLESIIKIFLYD